jgi:two-component system, LytTR family, response regulator
VADLIRVLIADDEPLAREKLSQFLARETDVEVVASCADGEQTIEAILQSKPDLAFLDVQMPGMTGFDVVAAVGARRMPVTVFVTAFDEHALAAFQAHALDYILKPYDRPRLLEVLSRAREIIRLRRQSKLVPGLLALLEGEARPSYPARRVVKAGGRYVVVKTDDIDWIESADNYVALHLQGGQRYLLRDTISGIEAELDPERFLRIRSSAIVNVDRVVALKPWSGTEYQIFLSDGTELLTSRRYRDRVRGFLNR